jgi:toxin secretion/phage lysis holin
MREFVAAAAGLTGALAAYALGGWDTALQTLIVFMAADYLSGIVLAGAFKKSKHGGGTGPSGAGPGGALSSRRCWRGLAKKGMQLVLVLAGYRLDVVMGTNFVRMAVIIAFISNELISLTENAALMGVPVPQALKKALEVLNHQGK